MNEEDEKPANPLLDVEEVDLLDEDEDEKILEEIESFSVKLEEAEAEVEAEAEAEAEVESSQPEEPPKPLSGLVQVSVRIPRVLRTRAKIMAARHQITLSTMMVKGLEMILEQLNPKKK